MKDESRKIWISYLDENNIKIECFAELIKLDSNMVRFKTHGNIIYLPTIRILKMKEKLEDEEKRGNKN